MTYFISTLSSYQLLGDNIKMNHPLPSNPNISSVAKAVGHIFYVLCHCVSSLLFAVGTMLEQMILSRTKKGGSWSRSLMLSICLKTLISVPRHQEIVLAIVIVIHWDVIHCATLRCPPHSQSYQYQCLSNSGRPKKICLNLFHDWS